MAAPAALQIDQVRAGYGRIPALFDVSLRVPQGSAVAVLGSNGAGKSTLLRTASGGLPCWSGRVRVNGRDIRGMRGWEVAELGLCYIPEGGGVFQELSVADNLDLALRSGRGTPRSLDELYEIFPILGTRRSQSAGSLSGGEKRMLALGRAVLTRPQIVLLDEPSLGLAPVVVDQVFETLERLHAQGTSLLVVEQFAQRALALADFAWVLAKGRVAFRGRPDSLADPTVLEQAYLGLSNSAPPEPEASARTSATGAMSATSRSPVRTPRGARTSTAAGRIASNDSGRVRNLGKATSKKERNTT
jgi:branched-chain amino acid transport system ATP-binding protein